MAKYTRSTLTGDNAPVNAELEKIQSAIDDQFDRNPTAGKANQLDGNLDANSNRIYNLAAPKEPNDAARLKDIQAAGTGTGVILPDQSGQVGEYLKTDGTTAFWSSVSQGDVGLANADNTSDLNKPVSTLQQTEINTRALQVDTFANLLLLTATTTGQAFICQERGSALYILQPEGVSALAGDAVFANSRLAQLQVDGYVDIRWTGAVELTDSTTAIQLAITRAGQQAVGSVGSDSRTIFSPVQVWASAGAYLVSSTLTQNKNFVEIVGAGNGSTVFYRVDGDYGDTMQVQPIDPTVTKLIGASVRGIKFDSRVEMNSGAHLRLESLSQFNFDDILFENGFINLKFGGLQSGFINNTIIKSGRYFSTAKAGSKFVEIFDSTFENTEVFVTNFNWTFTINPTIEVGLSITEGDGIWFSDGHILGAATDLLIDGTSSAQLMGMRFNDVWFDGFTAKNIVIKGVASGSFKNIDFDFCKLSGATSLGLHVESGCNVADVNFNGTSIRNSNGNGALLEGGKKFTFDGPFDDVARAGASNQYFIKVESGSGVEELIVTSKKMSATTIDYGIRILDSGCTALINDVIFKGVQTEEVDIPSSGFKGKVSGCTTDRANANDAAAASSVALPVISDVVSITGTTQIINTLTNVWEGRTVVLRGATAAHTLDPGAGNLLFNGDADITLNANRGIRITYSGAAWYDA